jgi:hypothetical protein
MIVSGKAGAVLPNRTAPMALQSPDYDYRVHILNCVVIS